MQIESVQKKFTKRIPYLAGLTYRNRLISLKLPTLELRRLRNDLILCYKIYMGMLRDLLKKYGIFYYLIDNHVDIIKKMLFNMLEWMLENIFLDVGLRNLGILYLYM